jgi:BirA family biotin operon repressor/biotin-[acetyl-CoA-carboxylase] ligase
MELQNVLERFCEFFEARYLQLKSNKLELIDKAYLDRLYRIGEWANYRNEQGAFQGRITGVSPIGKLQLELKSGELKSFGLKEIGFI